MNLGVFLLPRGNLSSYIYKLKKEIISRKIKHSYADHPPHMTLLNIKISNFEKAMELITPEIKKIQKFNISVDKKSVFENDIFTGGQTSYLGIKKNDYLFSIQKKLADLLKEFKKNQQFSNIYINNKKYKNSFQRYGFPFVGNHWIPHFTIASIKDKNFTSRNISENLNLKFEFQVKCLSLWEIEDNYHRQIEEIYFED